jgi:hypothetical protein
MPRGIYDRGEQANAKLTKCLDEVSRLRETNSALVARYGEVLDSVNRLRRQRDALLELIAEAHRAQLSPSPK